MSWIICEATRAGRALYVSSRMKFFFQEQNAQEKIPIFIVNQ